ncbi:CAP domain-containing protein [Streptomyces sp. NPDC056049]|uniref:CAP domain-containing protein n=1 Tax=Streptomyces sp. NPDC056049 TaxID=3345693 RepID=UPI0035E19E5E
MRYDGPDPSDPLEHPLPDTPTSLTPRPTPTPGTPTPDSAPTSDPTSGGRHRRGGPVRRRGLRRVLRRPSFPAAVLAAGTTAAAVTVLLGLYAATPPSASAPRAAGPSAPEARPPAPPTPAPGSPHARAEARRSPATPPNTTPATPPNTAPATTPGAGGTDGGLAPQTGSALAAPVTAPARAARYVRDVVALANAERDRAGCEPLRTEARLTEAAQGHADDMAARDYYAHDSPEGRDGGDRIKASGYAWSAWGENIHKGPRTPELAMDDWMESPAHRANIVNCAFRDIGVGVALTADGPWWVQDFGTKG